jgi:hypothetical protein
MEPTITQNGALYALQHVARNKCRTSHRKWLHADAIIRIDSLRPEASAARKMRREKYVTLNLVSNYWFNRGLCG